MGRLANLADISLAVRVRQLPPTLQSIDILKQARDTCRSFMALVGARPGWNGAVFGLYALEERNGASGHTLQTAKDVGVAMLAATLAGQRKIRQFRHMARKHPKHGPYEKMPGEEEKALAAIVCWLCGRPTGKTIVWHHPVPKSRGGRDVVPMHPICQQTLIANFTNSELQRHAPDVDALLANPNVRKFVDWVAKKDPDFTATITKKQR